MKQGAATRSPLTSSAKMVSSSFSSEKTVGAVLKRLEKHVALTQPFFFPAAKRSLSA